MKVISKTALVAVSAALMTVAPVLSGGPTLNADGFGAAYAKSENAGGNGNGGGNGGGRGGGSERGGGNAGGNGKGGSHASAGSHGNAGGNGKSQGKGGGIGATVDRVGTGVAEFLGGVFGSGNKGKSKSASVSRGKNNSVHKASLKGIDAVPAAHPKAKEKNLHARLAGLNSLNRSATAIMKANDPRMAAIRGYIDGVIAYEDAVAAAAVAAEALAAAQQAFAGTLEGVTPYGDYSYDGKTVVELNERLSELEGLDRTGLTDEENMAIDNEIAGLTEALGSPEATALSDAETKAAEAEGVAAGLEGAASDEALKEALLEAANDNRVAQYGDDYIDDEILGWAHDTLDGKIDEIRAAREAEEAAAAPEGEDAPAVEGEEAAAEEVAPADGVEVTASAEDLRLETQ